MATKAPPTLMEHALAASENVQALAVGLAHAGAVPDVISQLGKINGVLHQIIKALGSGPGLDNAAQNGQGAPPQAAPGPPQPSASAGPPSGPPQAAPAPAQGHAMAAAASALMAAHAAANAPQH